MSEEGIKQFFLELGEDPEREGLKDTPERVKRADNELYRGYKEDLDGKITTFNSEGYDQIILLKNIEYYSNCEHHIQPFYGKGHIAYIPNKKIVGISKLARILDHFSRRLQNQERITQQVADYIIEKLAPLGVAVVLEAQHFCMRARGIEKQNSVMVTSVLKGCFKNPEVRQEFFELIKMEGIK